MEEYLNRNIYLQDTPDEAEEETVGVETDTKTTPKVILFNDEEHTFDEVVAQIIKAIKCSSEKAESLTWEVHTKGKAVVYEGDIDECIKVSSILEEIALKTQIEY